LHENTTFEEEPFHNTGLYNLDGEGAYPEGNRGLYEITFEPGDMGRFRAPSLRNVAVTAPYMHDGSIATLSEVVDHYARGGRLVAEGPFAGDGAESPLKSEFVQGFELAETEKADLVAFLEALTDPDFLANPAFSNPWTQP
jgi:cytochrome c peroxidase